MSHRGLSPAEEDARLEHARSAPHPYLGVIHVYGAIAWQARHSYYRLLNRKLHRHGMKWRWRQSFLSSKHMGGRNNRAVDPERAGLEAQVPEWLYRRAKTPEPPPIKTAADLLRDAQRQAILPECRGTCSIIEKAGEESAGCT